MLGLIVAMPLGIMRDVITEVIVNIDKRYDFRYRTYISYILLFSIPSISAVLLTLCGKSNNFDYSSENNSI